MDIVGERFDLAIRGHVGQLQDSNLVQHPLARTPWYLFAGADYLERTSAPTQPEDLASHAIIAMAGKCAPHWPLQGPDKRVVTVPFEPRFQSNSLMSLKEAACANVGVAALPEYVCQAELQAGTLRQILPEWIAADARITALIPYRTGLLPAVRTLVDYLAVVLPKVTAFDRNWERLINDCGWPAVRVRTNRRKAAIENSNILTAARSSNWCYRPRAVLGPPSRSDN